MRSIPTLILALITPLAFANNKTSSANLHGGERGLSNCPEGNCGAYFGVRVTPEEGYQKGYSWYSAVWPLRHDVPAPDFQVGLGSTWVVADPQQLNGSARTARKNLCENFVAHKQTIPPFQSIEGGFGYWRDTHFASAMPKWRTHSNSNCYRSMEGLTGWPTQHNLRDQPKDIGMIQLSNRLLIPADGETFPLTTNGELLGVAWMKLPLPPLSATQIEQRAQATVLFMNAANFKGPLAYWPAGYFSEIATDYPALASYDLDVQALFMQSMASELGSVPIKKQYNKHGTLYTQIPSLHFPVDQDGRTIFAQNLTGYSEDALITPFKQWLNSKHDSSIHFNMSAAHAVPLMLKPHSPVYYQDGKVISGLDEHMQVAIFDNGRAWGLQWNDESNRGIMPAYFRDDNSYRSPIANAELPDDIHFADNAFSSTGRDEFVWHINYPDAGTINRLSKPGGSIKLSDGSTVTYVWFKFVDQPALQHWQLSPQQREELQSLVENLHHSWSTTRDYWTPPSSGSLVSFDPALLVSAPPGLEAGYVPIVIEQRGPQTGPPLP
jgi:hypothetical protein